MKQALLCGTVYGSSYLSVLSGAGAPLALGGILSRGSQRSLQFAQSMGVPHFLSLDELSDGQIDVVIVAVSGDAGVELALGAMDRGLHVLAEHPWGPDPIALALEAADKNGVCFHMNSHWGDLENVQHFLAGCRSAREQSPPAFVSLLTNPRTLFSGLDMLRRIIGPLDPDCFTRLSPEVDLEAVDARLPAFVVLQGQVGDTLVTLQNQSFTSQVDDGTSALVNHHLTVGYPHGHLTLAETTGPGVWVPDMTQLASMGMMGQSSPAWTPLPPGHAPTVGDFLQSHRVKANRLALERLLAHAEDDECPDEVSAEHLLDVAQTWARLHELTGPIAMIAGK